jgi:PhnB protein
MKVPAQYLPVMPYLIVKDAWALLQFAKDVFGATEQYVVETDDGGVMHGEMRIHEAVIMFAESNPQWPEKTAAMYLFVDNVDAIHARALQLEATELEAPAKKEYGYTSGFEDRHGNLWFIVQADV